MKGSFFSIKALNKEVFKGRFSRNLDITSNLEKRKLLTYLTFKLFT